MADELDPRVLLGSAYYVNNGDSPEQIRAGMAAMASSGLKLVRIFLQWTQVEPRQDRWDWSQYDALFDAAAEGGLGVIVTLTALHPPGWMKISYGPQDQGPLDDPAYWERARDYTRRVVARYGGHPALHSWILQNEPSIFLEQNPAELARFRRFVAQKYGGQIEQLNARSFQQLDSFDEIGFAGSGVEGEFSGYTLRLNWLDFVGYRLLEILADLKTVIRESGDSHPVHVNPHALLHEIYSQGQSIWAEGRLVDFMGCSAHPSWHSTRFLPDRLHQSVALFADLMRGATRAPGRYFWVSELQGGTNIYSGVNYLGPTAGDIRSWVWESIGAGAKGVIFWCFNYRNSGFEAGEWSLVDQQNRPSRRLRTVSEIAALLRRHEDLFAASRPARAPVAVLFSEASWKLGFLEGQGFDPEYPRNEMMAADALAGAFSACADAGLAVDILDEIDLQAGQAAGYPALILPGCTALEDASLPALKAYVENGGTLLVDGLCGYKQPDGFLRDVAANPLNELFQASIEDIQAVPAANTSATSGSLRLPVWFLQIALEPLTGTAGGSPRVLATFVEPDPRPALTLAGTGKGSAIRLGTAFFQHYFRHPDPQAFEGLRQLLPIPTEAVQLIHPSSTLRLRRLSLPQGELLVLVNSGEAVSAELAIDPGITLTRLTPAGEETLEPAGGQLRLLLPAQDAVVLRTWLPTQLP